MKRALARGVAAIAFASALAATLRVADAQRFDPRRASTFVVGSPAGPSPMVRVDARRSGASSQPLPTGTLRVAWRRSIGLALDQPALTVGDGSVAVVTTRGDVVFVDPEDGEEQARVTVAAGSVGPATVTADGTLVFATSAGDAVGVRKDRPRPRFITRVGGERSARAAPLALDDGGAVVATLLDLVALDGQGNVRARASLPEGLGHPLLASAGRVLAVSSTGAVYGWVPGREAVRLGAFEAAIDGGAALIDETTLAAVIEGNHLVELDLARGARSTRAIAAQGLLLGPPSVTPSSSAAPGGNIGARPSSGSPGRPRLTVLGYSATRAFVVSVDATGAEVVRAPIATFTAQALPDGGAPPLVAPAHTGPLVDARGTVAYASTDGQVGVVTPDGAVETLGDLPCARAGRSSGIAGLTPAGRGSFLVTCEAGVVVKVSALGPGSPKTRGAPAIERPAEEPIHEN